MLPLVCVSHPSPVTYWILQSLSLRYGNGRLGESYQACPYSVIPQDAEALLWLGGLGAGSWALMLGGGVFLPDLGVQLLVYPN